MYGKVCILKKVWFFSSLFIILIYPHFVCFLHVRVVYNVTKVGCLQKISSFFDLRVSTMLFTRVRRPCPPRPPHPLSPSLPYRVTSRPRLGPLPPVVVRLCRRTNSIDRRCFSSLLFFLLPSFFFRSHSMLRVSFSPVFFGTAVHNRVFSCFLSPSPSSYPFRFSSSFPFLCFPAAG